MCHAFSACMVRLKSFEGESRAHHLCFCGRKYEPCTGTTVMPSCNLHSSNAGLSCCQSLQWQLCGRRTAGHEPPALKPNSPWIQQTQDYRIPVMSQTSSCRSSKALPGIARSCRRRLSLVARRLKVSSCGACRLQGRTRRLTR